MNRHVALTLALLGCAPRLAEAQGVSTSYGAYNAAPMSLPPGAMAPLQLDGGGDLKIDCVLGCQPSGANASVSQGTAAAANGAWPVSPTQSGAPVSAGNPLYIQDPLDGAAIGGSTMPSGGAGILGWLSAIDRLLTATLTVGGTVSIGGVSGSPTASTGTLAASAAVLAAEPANVNRLHVMVANFATAGGASLYCTDDGSTPSPTSASFIVYAQGFYERDTPAWVPSAAINCVPSAGTVNYRAESYP